MSPQPDGSLVSRTVGLLLRTEGERLRLVDPQTGRPLPWGEEEAEAREAAEARAIQAEERVRLLEEELDRLRRQKS